MKIEVTARVDYLRWLVISLLATVYLVINLALPRFHINSSFWMLLIQSVLWGLMALAIWKLPPYRVLSKIRVKISVIQVALLIGFCQVMIYAIGGLFSSFGKSPMSFTITGIFINLLYVGSMLVGMEYSRAWLVNRSGKHHPALTIIVVGIIYTIINISLAQIIGLKPDVQAINTIGSSWLPLLAENLLASMLVLHGGVKPALIYRGLLAAFWWFSPILPDLSWGLKALIGVGMPFIGMLVLNQITLSISGKSRKRVNENTFPLGWILTAMACLVLVWFAIGLFPVKPALIPTGSMEPLINPGDIAIITKISADNIKLGDIIEYRTKTINVVHRVIKIEENGNFLTKGDANSIADVDPVDPRNVVGKEIFIVPKVGWISIAVKKLFGG